MVKPHKLTVSAENKKRISEYIEFKKTSVNDLRTLKRYDFFLRVLLSKIKKETQDIQEEDIIKVVNELSKKHKIGTKRVSDPT